MNCDFFERQNQHLNKAIGAHDIFSMSKQFNLLSSYVTTVTSLRNMNKSINYLQSEHLPLKSKFNKSQDISFNSSTKQNTLKYFAFFSVKSSVCIVRYLLGVSQMSEKIKRSLIVTHSKDNLMINI